MQATYKLVPGAPGLVSTCQALAKLGINYTVGIAAGHAPVPGSHRDNFHFDIQASGAPKHTRKVREIPKVKIEIGTTLTSEQCIKRLVAAELELDNCKASLKSALRRNWDSSESAYSGYTRRHSYESALWWHRIELGKVVARIIARHKTKTPYGFTQEDYRELDDLVSRWNNRPCKVNRLSALSKHDYERGYLKYIVSTYGDGYYYDTRKRERNRSEPGEKGPSLGFAGCKPWWPPEETKVGPIQQFLNAKAEVEHWREMGILACERETK